MGITVLLLLFGSDLGKNITENFKSIMQAIKAEG
jgi:hypothetical protein